ncbi:MAG TPA: S41 family peptidase [Clostridiales bacterium]|nr:S41 family peptidase [Clostridiales bacterium]HQP70777.1 S41 family peptidase [Clostridiales bacterium]
MSDKKFYITAVALLLAAILLSYRYETGEASSSGNSLNYFQKMNYILRIVDNVYVDEPDVDKVMQGAIEGMLKTLDPHSAYIPADKQKEVDEDFEGVFGGIGIEFEIKDKYLTVISAIPETPSERIGLMPGDKIIRIDSKTAYDITTEEVFKRLKGPIGSKVNITVARTGAAEPMDYEIIRAAIPVHSVIAECLLDDRITGYISINRFATKTAQELEDALNSLKKKGMERLILDLRGNPGGLMDQAVEIVEKFIGVNKLIVYTKGRYKDFDEEFYSTVDGKHKDLPLIILIDAGSASASEIVSGALQDHDRALIVGAKSFGKGLVQRPFDLGDGSVARITISRYFTPTGRLIQRPYDEGTESYYLDRYLEEDMTEKEKAKEDSIKKAQTFYTLNKKRVVYGGGGITPDTLMTYDPVSDLMTDLYRLRVFQDHSIDFYNSMNGKSFEWKEDFEKFYNCFDVSDQMITDFLAIAKRNSINIMETVPDKKDADKKQYYYTFAQFDKDKEKIKEEIKYNIARQYFKDKGLYPRIKAMNDKFVKKALKLFDEAKKLSGL